MTHSTGTGAGRPTGKPKRVPNVERLDCPDRDGPHWLTNDAQGRTYCRGCKVEWRVLDAEARAV